MLTFRIVMLLLLGAVIILTVLFMIRHIMRNFIFKEDKKSTVIEKDQYPPVNIPTVRSRGKNNKNKG